MSSSFPPVLTTASKLEQAREKVHELFVDADHARHCAHMASLELADGSIDRALEYVKEAQKPAGVLAARATWASHAVASAKTEAGDG